MQTALVTGANKGIGLEVARQLAQHGFFVYLGCRSLANGLAAAEKLQADGCPHVQAVQLDVTDQASIAAARRVIGAQSPVLDVLVNNAGVSGGYSQSALTVTPDQLREVFATNVFGVVGVTQAFSDLLRQSAAPRIVNVSSALASLALSADPTSFLYDNKLAAYQASKTALNMYTLTLAYELRATPFKVNMVCPGYTQTDMTGHQGTSTAQQAGQRIVKYALLGPEGPTGKFVSEEYFADPASCPW